MSFSESLFTPARPFLLRDSSHPSALGGVAIAREAVSAFTFEKRWELTATLRPNQSFTATPKGEPVPHLDERGLVRVGTEVRPGTVLVGVTDAPTATDRPPRDASLRCSPGVEGRVAEATMNGGEARVVVSAVRTLEPGDGLALDDGAQSVVTAIVDSLDGADFAWPGKAGNFLVARVSCAVDVLEARSIGPYSVVTLQPLGGRDKFGGQRIGPAEVEALRRGGAKWTLHELLTSKSDDSDSRTRLYEALVTGDELPPAGMPRSVRALERELLALGFDVDLSQPTVALGLLDEQQVRERMPGVVTKPDTLNYRTLRAERGGLFCEDVFGAQDSHRAVQMGRIELAAPVLHPWARATVARALSLDAHQLEQVLEGTRTLQGEEPADWSQTGAPAIRAALEQLPASAGLRASALCPRTWPVLPPDLRPLVPLDGGRFATSDLNDLYRRLINRSNRLKRLLELEAPDIILRNEAVQLQQALDALVENGARGRTLTGPNQRPLVSLGDQLMGPRGQLAKELLAKRCDYSGAAQVMPVAGLGEWEAKVPRSVMLELLKPCLYGELEQDGHATRIREAKQMVEARRPEALAALERILPTAPVVLLPLGVSSPRAGGFDVTLWDENVVGLSPVALERLGAGLGRVMVLLPLSTYARAEATGTLREPPLRPVADGAGGWLKQVADAERPAQALFDFALANAVDPVDDEYSRLLLGRAPQ